MSHLQTEHAATACVLVITRN